MRDINRKNLKHIPLILAFVIILLLPLLDNLFGIAPKIHFGEKRAPTSFPHYSQVGLKDYPKDFENYFQDHFGFRSNLIALNNQTMDKIFDASSFKEIIKGTNGWLFYDNDFTMADCRGAMHFSEKELSAIEKGLVRNWQELKKIGVTYLFVITPDKYSIYPEYLPDSISRNCQEGNRRIDQILNKIKGDYPNFPVLDLRAALKQAKTWEQVYHKTDTHWNNQGAYVGYYEIIQQLSSKYPNMKPKKRSDFNETRGTMESGDLAEMTGQQVKESNIHMQLKQPSYRGLDSNIGANYVVEKGVKHIRHYQNENTKLPNLLMLHDSFLVYLGEFLPENFGVTTYIRSKDLRNVNQYTCHIDLNMVKDAKANVVIQESVERKLYMTVDECVKIYK